MSREYFDLLCQNIISSVGAENFKSEVCIDTFLKDKYYMYAANVATSGGFISGEVRLSIAIRLLVGGDVYYVSVIFDARFDNCKRILYKVLL